MLTTIDSAGRLIVPKALGDELGFSPGTELQLSVVEGRLEVVASSRVTVEDGSQGVRFTVAEPDDPLSAALVRDLVERGQRSA